MVKDVTKNLLRNRTCDNCKWFAISGKIIKKTLCVKTTPAQKIPIERTCNLWQDADDKHLKVVMNDKDEVGEFFTKGRKFTINDPCEISGIQLYYGLERKLIYEHEFSDGPYHFPEGGGSLNFDVRGIDPSAVDQLVKGL